MNLMKKVFNNQNFKNIFIVTMSNALVLLAGVFTSFLIPKFLGLTEYGLYKTFTLYTSYTAIIEIGFFEGIYLKFTAVPEEKLELKAFRGYFKCYLLLITVVTSLFLLFSQIVLKNELKVIFLFVCIYAIISNVINYFQIISQCLLRFGEYAIRNTIKSVLLILSVSGFLILSKHGLTYSYVDFLVTYVSIFAVIVIWYVITYRRFIFGKSLHISDVKGECCSFIKNGFPLLIANLCSTLILTLDRQFVSILFSTEDYAIYSFAYSMLTLFTTLTSSISLIVFPSLKKLTMDILPTKYYEFEKYLFVLASVFLVLYFPLSIVIQFILPQYTDSLHIFQIILPTLGFSIIVSVLLQNYYKTLGMNKMYFKETVLVLLISTLLNGAFYSIFRTMESISLASFATCIIWYVVAYVKLKKIIDLKKSFSVYPVIYLIIVFCFWAITNLDVNIFVAMFLYILIGIVLFHNSLFPKKRG